jgi:hypothetical protein
MPSAAVSGLNQSLILLTLNWLIELIIDTATSEFRENMSYFEGFPVNDMILYNWLSVELPGKIGFPISISARMHPMLQISADFS